MEGFCLDIFSDFKDGVSNSKFASINREKDKKNGLYLLCNYCW